ncbi:MAG: 2-C-methyl-D-erythritol 4-phosphate cytidylyltransferase [Candidatus Omnitrophica bacterium]|nr:2-C-methyl-D-erythritol 4-phosphate cytidylyltransferase [Candidatus Omnitrophota bacterium]MDD5653238.1 2-C-methyl-D-erythritol 4-phosphate cytidylyltransferase [Candidatus Omnitrophota bacterium]
MIYVAAIVVAAGKGTRFNSKIPKPLVKLEGQAVIMHSLAVLSRHPDIKEIIVVVNPSNRGGILKSIEKSAVKKIKALVLGGARRQDSVAYGLRAVSQDASHVLIHDAARPLIEANKISAAINAAKKSGGAVLGVPVKDTIKAVDKKNFVKKNIDRSNLWAIQTPQVFKKELIFRAYKKFTKATVTDDASLVEKLGKNVSVVFGSYDNIKITTPEDLLIAQAIIKFRKR